ncbi:hypothetical protein C2W62_38185 [Candidatus Entotheonella serta]|nr:hypothetical protein C2W62_38185 [Candidatus Entotheonella serta]
MLRLGSALLTMPPAPPLPEPLPDPPEIPISYLNQLSAQISGSTPLSPETQSALVLDLRRHLADPTIAEDVGALLGQLRQRHDLLAWIAEEIDEALGTTSAALRTQITDLESERDNLRQRESVLQKQIEQAEAELLAVQQALTEEQAAHQAIQRE